MPLRRWFADHGVPTWWSWVVVFGSLITLAGISILVSVHSAQRAVEAERQARISQAEESRRQTEASLRLVCVVVQTQESVFQEADSPVGKSAAKAWHDLGTLFQCEKR